MSRHVNRRSFLGCAAGVAVAGGGIGRLSGAVGGGESQRGVIRGSGSPTAEVVGREVFAAGGNAVDAIVSAALTAGVVSPNMCGIGGYGGHMTIAMDHGRMIKSIDFNSTAPAAARHDMFKVDANGKATDDSHEHGWLATGVPGTLGGMQLALDQFGTIGFADAVAPAIAHARKGFTISAGVAGVIKRRADHFRADPGSAQLFFRDGNPPVPNSILTNPMLADMLQTLADRGRVDSFYNGDIGREIGAAFGRLGGITTGEDFAAYRAVEVEPIKLAYGDYVIHTAPLTAGGVTTIQALNILKALKWEEWQNDSARTQARLEAMRLVWHDRLNLLGDPAHGDVSLDRLLSDDYAESCAERVTAAVEGRMPVETEVVEREQGGTIHLSAADVAGNFVSLTLTHGNAFGAQVTVPGMGLILGHGVSRFDPRPNHPNSPGPGKRPLHNMCPTILTQDGRPVAALGGRGGRKIPNALLDVLVRMVALGEPLERAVAAPRMHTEGGLRLTMEKDWAEGYAARMKSVGYTVVRGVSATIDAVGIDGETGGLMTASR